MRILVGDVRPRVKDSDARMSRKRTGKNTDSQAGDTEPMEPVRKTPLRRKASRKSSPADQDRRAASVHGLSHEGQIRELNEDSWRWEPLTDDAALYAVADGMGGHDRGEVASELAISTLFAEGKTEMEAADGRDVETLKGVIHTSFANANRAVLECGRDNDSNMGTTLVTALVYRDSDAFVANVGDSRGYLLRGGSLQQVTRDHSLVAYLVQMGELTREQARTHPSGNILVRSVGSTDDVEIDVFHVPLQRDDALLLCSDGLWSELPDEEIQEIIVGNPDPKKACEALVARANEAGGKDNITCVVVVV